MKPFFLELTAADNKPLNINFNNVIYVKERETNKAIVVCVGGIEIEVNESFEEIADFVDIGIERTEG